MGLFRQDSSSEGFSDCTASSAIPQYILFHPYLRYFVAIFSNLQINQKQTNFFSINSLFLNRKCYFLGT